MEMKELLKRKKAELNEIKENKKQVKKAFSQLQERLKQAQEDFKEYQKMEIAKNSEISLLKEIMKEDDE